MASRALGQLLERNGCTDVLHFTGGLRAWEQARQIAEAAGLTMMMKRCLGATHALLGLGSEPD